MTTYKLVKDLVFIRNLSYEMEPYLVLDINRYVKCSLTRFRFGISDIFVHCMRYKSSVTARELM